MNALPWVAHDLGLVTLTAIVSGLTAYLVYTMLYPERI
jgi:hypothetical protein